ncbi:hypothetical protein, conserved in T. vivax [Trypanosoma vivax Y486]|uniref:Uncharacterized protein n=1 Tax=Trypanosoma vivax (strain Y486) TaxID=1055687 RepID=F9WKV8_TRYVY|nr:hypothetical protein, conserved in T. vivax [Trypanosoma vivax Y486]|eukprot:CCD18140.1 hypothetical protein, conserved in T. vivax [Trypanosoma vivax Y486]
MCSFMSLWRAFPVERGPCKNTTAVCCAVTAPANVSTASNCQRGGDGTVLRGGDFLLRLFCSDARDVTQLAKGSKCAKPEARATSKASGRYYACLNRHFPLFRGKSGQRSLRRTGAAAPCSSVTLIGVLPIITATPMRLHICVSFLPFTTSLTCCTLHTSKLTPLKATAI